MTEPKQQCVSRSRSEEITFKASAIESSDKKSPKARVASVDHRIPSPIKKFTIRPMKNQKFDFFGSEKLEDQNLEAPLQQQTPVVKLNQIESEEALAPNEIALISESLTFPDKNTSSDFIPDPMDTTLPPIISTLAEDITTPPTKTLTLNREMKNLQQSANSSKVLSNFLTNTDTPRRRKNKEQSIPPADTESEIESVTIETDSMISMDLMDKEIPIKNSPSSNNESDSTIVLQDEKTRKSRKSTSRQRSRSRSRGRRGRKSIVKMMNEELSAQSEKEENDENVEDVEETVFVQPKIFENRATNPPPKPGWDSFCFKCHLDNAVLSLACSKCKCSYHRACVRPNPIPKNADEFICPECRDIQIAEESEVNKFGHQKIDQHVLKEMLMTILETIRTQTGRDFFENDIPFKHSKDANPLIVTQMSYKTIEERIMNCIYKTTESFLHDMKQIEHNWTLVDKSKAKALKPVMKYIIGDINEMESCIHCYSSAFVVGNWFSAACKRPHLLVWAKLKGYPYWPAKVMSVDIEKQLADVRFFGAHDRAYIPTQHCLIFCEKDPNKGGKGTPTNNKKGIGDALKETEDYIANVSVIYGFEYSTSKETLDPKNFQAQLEKQLPKLKNHTEKDTDTPQKEKLTLKFIRTSDGNKSAENASKITEKERHPLYRVLSKADSTETESVQKAAKVRRNTIDSQKSSKSRRSRLHSETSESNLSNADSSISMPHKRTTRGPGKRKKVPRSAENSPEEPNAKRFCPPDDTDQLLEEIPAPKAAKRVRNNRSRSTLQNEEQMPLVVPVVSVRIPMGTDEIRPLREDSNVPPRTKNRSRSLNRSQSQDKDPKPKKGRRNSVHPTSQTSVETKEKRPPISIMLRRLSSTTTSTSKGGTSSRQRSVDAPQSIQSTHEFPSIEIKSEPSSDVEEVVMTDQVTVNDIPELVADNNSKRKTILITSDNSNDSQITRARKSFPNSVSSRPNSRENSQARSQNPMVCIPQVFPPAKTTNVNGHSSAPGSRRSSQNEILPPPPVITNLPRLIPKPSGVFTQDGSNYQFESGAVSALFSENAHRMTDYFKSLLIDTIGAVSSGIPTAEITLLKLENEKLKQHAIKAKNEHNLTIERMKREHMEEIRVLRNAYDEKIRKFEENAKSDLEKAKAEIRHMCEIEKQLALDTLKKEYKKTTWCSFCLKEARFYCCWNTSYCGQTCQREHWLEHQKNCRNTNTNQSPTTTTVARESPNSKRTTAPTAQIAPIASQSNILIVPPASAHNATVVTPLRKASMNAVQSISGPISTPTQYELRAVSPQQKQPQIQPQPSPVVMPANTIIRHIMQQNIRPITTIHPPALVQTIQPKKNITEKSKSKIQQLTPTSVVVNCLQRENTNSPPINIISSPLANTNLLTPAQVATLTTLNHGNQILAQIPFSGGVATIVPVVSKSSNN